IGAGQDGLDGAVVAAVGDDLGDVQEVSHVLDGHVAALEGHSGNLAGVVVGGLGGDAVHAGGVGIAGVHVHIVDGLVIALQRDIEEHGAGGGVVGLLGVGNIGLIRHSADSGLALGEVGGSISGVAVLGVGQLDGVVLQGVSEHADQILGGVGSVVLG